MTQLASCFIVSGTPLERAGQQPLLAIERRSTDGRLVDASVVDPQLADPLAAMNDLREA